MPGKRIQGLGTQGAANFVTECASEYRVERRAVAQLGAGTTFEMEPKLTDRVIETSPQIYARIGGVLYLFIIVVGFFAEVSVRSNLIVSGDAAATANNIVTHESLWRLGGAGELLMLVCDVTLALILYVLLRPVNRNLALLAAFFRLVFAAVYGINAVAHFAALLFLSGANYLKAFTTHQLQDLAYVSVKLHAYGYDIGLIFFGFHCLLLGYLIFRSDYLPKFLGVLLTIGALGYLINSFSVFLAPAFEAKIFLYALLPGGLAEYSLCLWLIVMGVNVPKWKEIASRLPS